MRLFNVSSLSDADFLQILAFLSGGGVMGFPTDTAYGLGADPFNDAAVSRIFEIKGRPETKPILLLVDSLEMVERIASWTPAAKTLAAEFWPGPLTLILPALRGVPDIVTAGTGTIGVRLAAAPFARRVMRHTGKPMTATSANRSGLPAPVTAEGVAAQLEDRLELLVDGGHLPASGGSTIVDVAGGKPRVVRQGPVSAASIAECLHIPLDAAGGGSAPGGSLR